MTLNLKLRCMQKRVRGNITYEKGAGFYELKKPAPQGAGRF